MTDSTGAGDQDVADRDSRFSPELITELMALCRRHGMALPTRNEDRRAAYQAVVRAAAVLAAAYEGQAAAGIYGRHALIDPVTLMGGADAYGELERILEDLWASDAMT